MPLKLLVGFAEKKLFNVLKAFFLKHLVLVELKW